jgi:hypothetical protein
LLASSYLTSGLDWLQCIVECWQLLSGCAVGDWQRLTAACNASRGSRCLGRPAHYYAANRTIWQDLTHGPLLLLLLRCYMTGTCRAMAAPAVTPWAMQSASSTTWHPSLTAGAPHDVRKQANASCFVDDSPNLLLHYGSSACTLPLFLGSLCCA